MLSRAVNASKAHGVPHLMSDILTDFHFAQPLWLVLIPCIAVGWLAWRRFYVGHASRNDYSAFADAHLLPFLLRNVSPDAESRSQMSGVLAALSAVCMVLALAGPRWDYDEQTVFQRPHAMVVVLDLSRSMLGTDVKPNRLERAKQEITDLLQAAEAKGISVGLVGYASTAHVLSPITEGVQTIKSLLPSLEPQLFAHQGSDPLDAIKQARTLLQRFAEQTGAEQGHILLITDGDMPDSIQAVNREAVNAFKASDGTLSIATHVLGVGTQSGAPVADGKGSALKTRSGKVHISRMDAPSLVKLVQQTGGTFTIANYRGDDTKAIIDAVEGGKADDALAETTHRIWRERYIIPLLIAMLLCMFTVPSLHRQKGQS